MRKKVVHISQSILAGVEAYFREVITYSVNKYDQVLVTPSSTDIDDFCAHNNVRRYVVDMVRNVSPLSDFVCFIKLCKILKREKPDLVHLHSAKAGILGRLACAACGYKSLYTPHGVSYLSFKGLKRLLFMFVEVIFTKFTYSVLAVSNSEANRLTNEVGFNPSLVYVVPNFISVPIQQPERTFDLEKAVIKIGTMARLTPQKNPLLFIDVANEVIKLKSNVEFYILGGGHHAHLQKEVEERMTEYNITNKVHILNWTDVGNVESFLNDMDIFLLTSIFEGLPISLLEAMNNGLPCIVSKCDGCNDVIQNEVNGFSCMTKEEYSSTIIKLILNSNLYTQISYNAQEYVRSYHNSEFNILDIHSIYNLIINN